MLIELVEHGTTLAVGLTPYLVVQDARLGARGRGANLRGDDERLTVYAVPQVIAAALPLGAAAVQMGTLVKLVRVLMVGPVCLVLSLVAPQLSPQHVGVGEFVADEPTPKRLDPAHLVLRFLIGFLALVACRSLRLVPTAAIAPIGRIATLPIVVSMAALGLGVV